MEFDRDNGYSRCDANAVARTNTHTDVDTNTNANASTDASTDTDANSNTYIDGHANTDHYIWHHLFLRESSPGPSAKRNPQPNWYYVGLNLVRRFW
jgi:hypothetical protein